MDLVRRCLVVVVATVLAPFAFAQTPAGARAPAESPSVTVEISDVARAYAISSTVYASGDVSATIFRLGDWSLRNKQARITALEPSATSGDTTAAARAELTRLQDEVVAHAAQRDGKTSLAVDRLRWAATRIADMPGGAALLARRSAALAQPHRQGSPDYEAKMSNLRGDLIAMIEARIAARPIDAKVEAARDLRAAAIIVNDDSGRVAHWLFGTLAWLFARAATLEDNPQDWALVARFTSISGDDEAAALARGRALSAAKTATDRWVALDTIRQAGFKPNDAFGANIAVELRKALEDSVAEHPTSIAWRRSLADDNEDRLRSLGAPSPVVAERESIALAAGGDQDSLADLANAHLMVGHLYWRLADATAHDDHAAPFQSSPAGVAARIDALEAYDKALAIWRVLAMTAPDTWNVRIVETLSFVGQILVDADDLSRARDAYTKAQTYLKSEPIEDTGDEILARGNVTVDLADVEIRSGDDAKAIALYRGALEVNRLRKAHKRIAWLPDSLILQRMSRVQWRTGDKAGAIASARKALALDRSMEAFPRDLYDFSSDNLATLILRDRRASQAQAALDRSTAFLLPRIIERPDEAVAFADTLVKDGDHLTAAGDVAAGIAMYCRAESMLAGVANIAGSPTEAAFDHMIFQRLRADFLRDRRSAGCIPRASATIDLGLARPVNGGDFATLMADTRAAALDQTTARAMARHSATLLDAGRADDAIAAARRGVDSARRAARTDAHAIARWRDLAVAWESLARALSAIGDRGGAAEASREAEAANRHAASLGEDRATDRPRSPQG